MWHGDEFAGGAFAIFGPGQQTILHTEIIKPENRIYFSLPAGDRAGIERLVGYMTRCPFSLSRLVKVSETGQVVYMAEKDACRAFPDPQRDELARGPQRNFQILERGDCAEPGLHSFPA